MHNLHIFPGLLRAWPIMDTSSIAALLSTPSSALLAQFEARSHLIAASEIYSQSEASFDAYVRTHKHDRDHLFSWWDCYNWAQCINTYFSHRMCETKRKELLYLWESHSTLSNRWIVCPHCTRKHIWIANQTWNKKILIYLYRRNSWWYGRRKAVLVMEWISLQWAQSTSRLVRGLRSGPPCPRFRPRFCKIVFSKISKKILIQMMTKLWTYLIRLSVMPSFARASAVTEAWVIKDGTQQSDSTPPRDSARVKTWSIIAYGLSFPRFVLSNEETCVWVTEKSGKWKRLWRRRIAVPPPCLPSDRRTSFPTFLSSASCVLHIEDAKGERGRGPETIVDSVANQSFSYTEPFPPAHFPLGTALPLAHFRSALSFGPVNDARWFSFSESAHMKRLDAPVDEEAVEWRRNCSDRCKYQRSTLIYSQIHGWITPRVENRKCFSLKQH